MRIERVALSESIGLLLSHDLTQVDVEKRFKGARFCRGHEVKIEDIPILKAMGREELAVLFLEEGDVHEDEASLRLAQKLAGPELAIEGPSEGKCSLVAQQKGFLLFNEEIIHKINRDLDWVLATLPSGIAVERGERVASFRVAPLVIKEEQIARAEEIAEPLSLLLFQHYSVGLVTTGKEIVDGHVQDAFEPRLRQKLQYYGAIFAGQTIVGDLRGEIISGVQGFLEERTKIIICTGGMSVDVEDRTPGAIAHVADEVIFQGIPVLPGSNLMLARKGETYIIGAPACIVACNRTSLDLLLNHLFAGVVPTRETIRRWGVGGLCRNCASCIYPACSFAVKPR